MSLLPQSQSSQKTERYLRTISVVVYELEGSSLTHKQKQKKTNKLFYPQERSKDKSRKYF
jgi:hypothetical protein